MIGATALVATTATAQVVVTDIPQIAGSTLYENCVLSGNGNFVAMTTNEATPRLVRWTASSNTFLPFNAPPGRTVPYARHVTDIGSITGGAEGATPGFIWFSDGTVAADPLWSPPRYTWFASPSQNGAPFFLSDYAWSGLYRWNVLGAPILIGKPAGAVTVLTPDASADGVTCLVNVDTTQEVSGAYRWTAAGGFQPLPFLDGPGRSNPAVAISDDGSRVVGYQYFVNGKWTGAQGYYWSASTGIVSMGFQSPDINDFVNIVAVNGDCSLVCGTYFNFITPEQWQPFVWSPYGGLMTARNFLISRGYDPGSSPFEIRGLSRDGRTALLQQGSVTRLLQNLGRSACGSTGSCFASKTTPGCADATCCERVCGLDPYCCDGMWDTQCVTEAESLCRTGATCADPVRVTSYVAWSYDYNTGLDGTSTDESSCGGSDLKAVWRVYRAPCGGAVTIDTCTEFATGPITLSVFSSCGTEIACSAGAFVSCGATRAAVGFDSVANTDYLIRIASAGGDAAGSISISCESSCGAPTSGACNVVHVTGGCSDAACCAIVCANDAYCCDFYWDAQCVGEADGWCTAPGDFDRDGDIDAGDLSELLAGWGLGGVTDIDGDGLTGASDLSMLLANWG